jgi:hypothetical protein
MRSLIAFATQWGSKYGGINTFNTDFLSAFGIAYHSQVQVICIVSRATIFTALFFMCLYLAKS